MGEWDGIELAYIPQCAVCKQCDGLGCKAFQTKKRDSKYYDSRNDIWMQIPSGWIAAYYDGETFVK